MIKKKSKTKTRSQLVKELDAIYSNYIRLKGSDKNGNCKCVTCNKVDHYKRMQNGHFVSRANYKYRRSDDNCEIQCPVCNVRLNGNYKQYTLFMINKYGKEWVEQRLGEIKGITQIKNDKLLDDINYYKDKVKALYDKIEKATSTI